MYRFRRGVITVGTLKCDACDRVLLHGDTYLTIDEKPSDKVKEEIAFADDIACTECGKKLENGETYLFVLDGDAEKVYCAADYKKGGDALRKKSLGVPVIYKKTSEKSRELHFCADCSEKRKAGAWRKDKGDKVFTIFTGKTGKER